MVGLVGSHGPTDLHVSTVNSATAVGVMVSTSLRELWRTVLIAPCLFIIPYLMGGIAEVVAAVLSEPQKPPCSDRDQAYEHPCARSRCDRGMKQVAGTPNTTVASVREESGLEASNVDVTTPRELARDSPFLGLTSQEDMLAMLEAKRLCDSEMGCFQWPMRES